MVLCLCQIDILHIWTWVFGEQEKSCHFSLDCFLFDAWILFFPFGLNFNVLYLWLFHCLFMLLLFWAEGLLGITSLPYEGRGKVCVHPTLPGSHLVDYMGMLLLLLFLCYCTFVKMNNPISTMLIHHTILILIIFNLSVWIHFMPS